MTDMGVRPASPPMPQSDPPRCGHVRQKPIGDKRPETFGEMLWIVEHPAFRLGFLDAQHGKPHNHDHIVERIAAETPINALRRLGWDALHIGHDLFGLANGRRVEIAQYRYEEGRLAVVQWGLRCKAWGHPDFPPKRVIDKLLALSSERVPTDTASQLRRGSHKA